MILTLSLLAALLLTTVTAQASSVEEEQVLAMFKSKGFKVSTALNNQAAKQINDPFEQLVRGEGVWYFQAPYNSGKTISESVREYLDAAPEIINAAEGGGVTVGVSCGKIRQSSYCLMVYEHEIKRCETGYLYLSIPVCRVFDWGSGKPVPWYD